VKLSSRNVVIVGATSGIAIEVSRLLAEQGCGMVLGARDPAKLEPVVADLRVRGATPLEAFVFDANDFSKHAELFDFTRQALGSVDVLFVAHGTLPQQSDLDRDPEGLAHVVSTNATSVMSLVTRAAAIMEDQGAGLIAVVSSVAGDRGRPSNYAYGATKSAISTFLAGLRARVARSGVVVVTIKPGFVDTPLVAHLKKNFLFASTKRVAKPIVRAMERGRPVVYVPWFWRWVMVIVRLIPEPLFRRLKL